MKVERKQITRPTKKNYEAIINSLRRFFILEIYRLVKVKRMSMREISATIGKNPSYLEKTLARGSFSSLRRLYEEVKDL